MTDLVEFWAEGCARLVAHRHGAHCSGSVITADAFMNLNISRLVELLLQCSDSSVTKTCANGVTSQATKCLFIIGIP